MLNDLDYADDIYLLAYHHSKKQAMVVELAFIAAMLGLAWFVGVYACVRTRACVR